jgi:hypothetical protein
MKGLENWAICDELTVVQAALLMNNVDPTEYEGKEHYEIAFDADGYTPARIGISNALRRGAIKGEVVPEYDYDRNAKNWGAPIEDSIDDSRSRVLVESLREWLKTRGCERGFFFPESKELPDYLNPSDPRYAPKLAAAIRAWEATSNVAIAGKSPKQVLTEWLVKHASEFDLLDRTGKPNHEGIDQIAKVANWQPLGGAPKTPTA